MTNLGGTGVSENTDFDDEITALFDRQDRLNPATLAAWQADPTAKADDVVTTKVRTTGVEGSGAKGDVISGIDTVNGTNRVQHDTLSLTWVLREGIVKSALKYGAVPGADSSGALVALLVGGGNIVIEPFEYILKTNWILEDSTWISARGASFLAQDDWVDNTIGSVQARSVVLLQGIEDVEITGLEVSTGVTIASDATTPFMIRGCKKVILDLVTGTHPDSRTLTINPFDIEGTNEDVQILRSTWRNETGSSSGLCSIRHVANTGLTKNIKILYCNFIKDSGDEALAVFGVLGKVTDVEIMYNTISSTQVKATHGTLVSIFPLASVLGNDAEVNNVRFMFNNIVADGFVNSIIRVGAGGDDTSHVCDKIFIEHNTITVTNAPITSLLIRFIKDIGSNVTCNNNKISQVGTDICQAFIAGPWGSATGNEGSVFAKQLFEGCNTVSENIGLTNLAANGHMFLNCERYVNNTTTAERGGRIEAATLTTEVRGNKLTITGEGADTVLSSSDLATGRISAFIFEDNDVLTTNVNPLNVAIALDADDVLGINTCKNNTFRGTSPTEVYSGFKQKFSIVEGNEWWDYVDGISSVRPFRTAGYNNMVPIGNFVTSSVIGTNTGAQLFGWTKQEGNGAFVDWKDVTVTISVS